MNNFLSQDELDHYQIVEWGYTEQLNPTSYNRFEKWIKKEHHGELKYLSDHRKDARKSLSEVMNTCKSALVFLFSYHPQKIALEEFYQSKESNGLKIAGYCFGFEGNDYHLTISKYLNEIGEKLKNSNPNINWRQSLDIQPVLERDLAFRSGLGWFGKNSMMINRKHGSFLMIGSLLLDQTLSLSSKPVETDHCGQCRACIESCPTDAIEESSRTLIAERCISTFTIEHFKEVSPPEKMELSSGEIFGCDICQDVCPWNKRPMRLGLKGISNETLKSRNKLVFDTFLTPSLDKVIEKVESFSGKKYAKQFFNTPLGRTGKKGMLKNLMFWKKVKTNV